MSMLYPHNTEMTALNSVLSYPESGFADELLTAARGDIESLFTTQKTQTIARGIKYYKDKNISPSFDIISDYIDSRFSDNDEENIEFSREELSLGGIAASQKEFSDTLSTLVSAREQRKQYRLLEGVLADIADNDKDISPGDVVKNLQQVIDNTSLQSRTRTFAEVFEDVINAEAPMWNVDTGIKELNQVLGGYGLESGCLTVIAARPKVGKTSLMNSLVNTVLDTPGAVPVVLNLETKDIEFLSKIMAGHLKDPDISWGNIKSSLSHQTHYIDSHGEEHEISFTKRQTQLIEEAYHWAATQDWRVEFDKTTEPADIESLVREEIGKHEKNTKIVLFVDYLQLQIPDKYAFKERESITQLSRFYKKLAGKLGISVVLLSQMNREGGKEGELDIRHLRGSGSIEQDADTIIMLDRPALRDEDEPPEKVFVDVGTTRLAQGRSFYLHIDSATNVASSLDDTERLEWGIGVPDSLDEVTEEL